MTSPADDPRLRAQLDRWHAAGLIDEAQVVAIVAHERARGPTTTVTHHAGPAWGASAPSLSAAVGGLGALAIALGAIALVAANWAGIPPELKLALAFGCVAIAGGSAWVLERRGPAWAFEASVVVHAAFVLGAIALIGQQYQLSGSNAGLLAAWLVLASPMLARARSGFVATVWVLGAQVTWLAWLGEIGEDEARAGLATAGLYWAPLAALGLARSRALARVRPALALALAGLGRAELLWLATLGTFAFYADTAREDWSSGYPLAIASVAATVALAWTQGASFGGATRDAVDTRDPSAGAGPRRALWLTCLAAAHVPVLTSTGGLSPLAALAFIAVWGVAAWEAHAARDLRRLNTATGLIGLRLVAVYFEVFGTLFDTGVGLIVGGVLTLTALRVWTRVRARFGAELEAASAAERAGPRAQGGERG